MIESIKELTIDTFKDLVEYLKSKRFSLEEIAAEIGTKHLDNGYGTFFYTPKNEVFNSISISQKKDIINEFGFIGNFNITFTDLKKNLGDYTEKYSFKDDLYFYSFEEIGRDYTLQVVFDKKMDSDLEKEKLRQFSVVFNQNT